MSKEPTISLYKRFKMRLILLLAGDEPYILNTAIIIKPKSAKFTQFVKGDKHLIEYRVPRGKLYLDSVNILSKYNDFRLIRELSAPRVTYKESGET